MKVVYLIHSGRSISHLVIRKSGHSEYIYTCCFSTDLPGQINY